MPSLLHTAHTFLATVHACHKTPTWMFGMDTTAHMFLPTACMHVIKHQPQTSVLRHGTCFWPLCMCGVKHRSKTPTSPRSVLHHTFGHCACRSYNTNLGPMPHIFATACHIMICWVPGKPGFRQVIVAICNTPTEKKLFLISMRIQKFWPMKWMYFLAFLAYLGIKK